MVSALLTRDHATMDLHHYHRDLTLPHHIPVSGDPASIVAAWARVHVGSLLTRETAPSAPRYDGTTRDPRNDDRLLAPLVAVVA